MHEIILKYDVVGEVIVVYPENYEDALACCEEIKNYNLVGFDTETSTIVPSSPVNLVQLAIKNKCWLFHIHKILFNGEFPPCLAKLLHNPNVVKSGIAVDGDARKLKQDYDVECGGILDLQHVARVKSNKSLSLFDLCDEYGIPMQKEKLGKYGRMCDWSQNLDIPMAKYAAMDGVYSFWLCSKMLTPEPPKMQNVVESEKHETIQLSTINGDDQSLEKSAKNFIFATFEQGQCFQLKSFKNGMKNSCKDFVKSVAPKDREKCATQILNKFITTGFLIPYQGKYFYGKKEFL